MTQGEALEILKTGVNVFLTGEPGSGKTHTINTYVSWLHERGVHAAVTASTGIAATHLGGTTIHSWSGIGIRKHVSEEDVEYILSKEKTARRILEARVLIVDEISMLDAATLDGVELLIRTMRRGVLAQGEPFGGMQVVFVGDFFQLPPVNKTEEQTKFAFESESWKAANPIICYLHEQHRQEDHAFLELLSAMRRGEFSNAHKALLASRSDSSETATKLYTHNADVDRINEAALRALPGSARVYQMSSRGAANLVESLKKNCLSPETLTLKQDASVMFTRNNPDQGYYNGTLGTVAGTTALGAPIVRTRQNTLITVEPVDWTIQDGNKILARISQLPLRLAWAITVHKSQGMSLDAATIDLGRAFEYGQGYVALSRVRTLGGLFLEGFNERALQMHPQVVAYDAYARKYSDAAAKKFASLTPDTKAGLASNFLRAIGGKNP